MFVSSDAEQTSTFIKIYCEHGALTSELKLKSAVRESGRISELKCLELFEGIVPGFAVRRTSVRSSSRAMVGLHVTVNNEPPLCNAIQPIK